MTLIISNLNLISIPSWTYLQESEHRLPYLFVWMLFTKEQDNDACSHFLFSRESNIILGKHSFSGLS